MTLLSAEHLTVRYGARTVVEDVGFSVGTGEWLMLIGPNGAGKSTVVNAVSQAVPCAGTVRFRGEDVRACRPAALARRIGVLSQSHHVGYAFTVGEVVRLGRYAHAPGLFSRGDAGDAEAVRAALKMTGLTALAGQSVLTLSGGELQRTFLAQLFAQNPDVLILDEPANHLDLVYQKQIFSLLRDWLMQGERAIVSVVHDLSLARAYGTGALLLSGGKTAACGGMDEVFCPDRLDAAYGMDVAAWMRGLLAQWGGAGEGSENRWM